MKKFELIILTEKGYLESMSKLLVYSLRTFGGKFKDIPIYSYQPRKDFRVSKKTLAFFEKYEVEYIDENLNTKFVDYPYANKPLACAHRELNTNAEHLIYSDCDIFFLNEPAEFDNFGDSDVIIRPVYIKNVGTGNENDENAAYWRALYAFLNVKVHRMLNTSVDNHRILEYYNGGHIFSKTRSALFAKWNENFIKTMDHGLKPDEGGPFR